MNEVYLTKKVLEILKAFENEFELHNHIDIIKKVLI